MSFMHEIIGTFDHIDGAVVGSGADLCAFIYANNDRIAASVIVKKSSYIHIKGYGCTENRKTNIEISLADPGLIDKVHRIIEKLIIDYVEER